MYGQIAPQLYQFYVLENTSKTCLKDRGKNHGGQNRFVRRSTQIKDGDKTIGNRTRVKIVKNKVAPPFRGAQFDIMYGEGISKMGEIIDIGSQSGIIDKSGSWFSYGDTKLGQGRDAVKTLLKDNPELCEELEKKISEILSSDNS